MIDARDFRSIGNRVVERLSLEKREVLETWKLIDKLSLSRKSIKDVHSYVDFFVRKAGAGTNEYLSSSSENDQESDTNSCTRSNSAPYPSYKLVKRASYGLHDVEEITGHAHMVEDADSPGWFWWDLVNQEHLIYK